MEAPDPIVARPRRRSLFPYQAAKIGATIPPIALLASAALRTATGKIDWARVLNTGIYPLGLVETAACAMGVLFSLIALAGISARGTKGLLFPGVGGLVMSVGLLALAVLQLQQQDQHRRQAMAIGAAEEELRRAMLDRYIEQRDFALSLGDIGGLVDQVDGADLTTVERAVLLEVAAEISQTTSEWVARFEREVRAFTEAKLLDLASIDTRAETAARKQKAQKFLEATIEFRDDVAQLESTVRRMLGKTNLAEPTKNQFVATFLENSKADREIAIGIREQDVRVATAVRDLLEFLESTWGKWVHDPDDRVTEFDTKELAERFNQLTEELQRASGEAVRRQERRSW